MKNTKRFAMLLAIVMLMTLFGGAAMAKGGYLGTLRVVNCASWVTLRASPSTGSASVTRVPLGALVEGYYYNSEFTECYYGGWHGYILSTYLSDGTSGSASSASSNYLGKKTIVNCNEFVTLRQYASTSAPTVTKVAKGQQVDAYYYNDTFTRCYYNGLEGYILNRYLSGSGASYASGSYLGTMRVVNCNSYVTLRQSPSTSAYALARVYKGSAVEAYYYNSEFAECYYNGMRGFILLRYLG